jgi:3-phosphoshikimate 1-carboxyvinyltransferase
VVDASVTSQSLSAINILGVVAPGGIDVVPVGDAVSAPYVEMTRQVAHLFRVAGLRDAGRPGAARPEPAFGAVDLEIEGDWSGAAFLLAAAQASGGEVVVEGLNWDTAQADRKVVGVLRDAGALVEAASGGARARGGPKRPVEVDLRDAPDLAPLVGALACLAPGVSRVRGAAHLRVKESDRIATVVDAARALGCRAEPTADGFEVEGPATHGGTIATRHDHRIAMAFAVAGLAVPGVVLDDPGCAAKSYPGFWHDLRALTGV